MGFLLVPTCVSLNLHMVLVFYSLSLVTLIIHLGMFIISYLLLLMDVCLYSMQKNKEMWIWMGRELGKMLEELEEGKP